MSNEPKRAGRPEGKRGTFSFRVTPSLRAELEAAASANARPVSEEIEARLTQSFSEDRMRSIIREELARAEEQKIPSLMRSMHTDFGKMFP